MSDREGRSQCAQVVRDRYPPLIVSIVCMYFVKYFPSTRWAMRKPNLNVLLRSQPTVIANWLPQAMFHGGRGRGRGGIFTFLEYIQCVQECITPVYSACLFTRQVWPNSGNGWLCRNSEPHLDDNLVKGSSMSLCVLGRRWSHRRSAVAVLPPCAPKPRSARVGALFLVINTNTEP